MFSASAELYDAIYRSLKNYAGEAEQIVALLAREAPACRTLLDVACGTGEHAVHFAQRGYAVDGIDLDPALVEIAAAKNPGGRFSQGDMCAFDLGRRYDAVLCLFSSIGYAVTLPRVTAALACFRRHLAPGGMVLVEPWFAPGVLDPERVDSRTFVAGGLEVSRTSRIEITGRVSRLTFEYDIGRGAAARRASELHELGLFTREEMESAFQAAGLAVAYDAVGISGRGLYRARVP